MSSHPVVLKFGGTSVRDASAMLRVVEITGQERDRSPVVVTSACAGATDKLLEAARLAGEGDRQGARDVIEWARAHHLSVLSELDVSDRDSCDLELRGILDELDQLIDGVILLRELTPRSIDAFASQGERLSSLLLTAAFRRQGWQAALADSRSFISTDDCFCNARPLIDEIDRRAPAALLPLLVENEVVVAQGFIGSTIGGDTTTIGRGGSDHSAAIIGASIGAREIQIWTDVSGILSADPRVVPNARVVPEVTFTEARELAYFGAKVLHPDTILPAVARNIPVVILNSTRPQDAGTRILPDGSDVPSGVHAVTVKRSMSGVEIAAKQTPGSPAVEQALALFAEQDVTLHCALTVEARAVAVVDNAQFSDVLMTSLEARFGVSRVDDLAIIAVIGSGLRIGRGILSPVFAALADFPIRFVIAGSSDHVALFGLDQADADHALAAVHDVIVGDVMGTGCIF